MWWASVCIGGRGQSGKRHPESRIARAWRCPDVKSRFLRPYSVGILSGPRSTRATLESQLIRAIAVGATKVLPGKPRKTPGSAPTPVEASFVVDSSEHKMLRVGRLDVSPGAPGSAHLSRTGKVHQRVGTSLRR